MQLIIRAVTLILIAIFVVLFWIWRVKVPDASPLSSDYWAAVELWGKTLVSLGWVDKYQTLVAGVLAIAAGAFALLSTVQQRRYDQADAAAEKRERILTEMSTVLASFFRAWRVLAGRDLGRETDKTLPIVQASAIQIGTASPELAGRLVLAAHQIDAALDSHPHAIKDGHPVAGTDHMGVKRGLARAEGYLYARGFSILLQHAPSLLHTDGSIVLRPMKATHLLDEIRGAGIEPKSMALFIGMFEGIEAPEVEED